MKENNGNVYNSSTLMETTVCWVMWMRKQEVTMQSGKCNSTNWDLYSDNPGFKSQLYHVLTGLLWTNYLLSIDLSFFVYKMDMIIIPDSCVGYIEFKSNTLYSRYIDIST